LTSLQEMSTGPKQLAEDGEAGVVWWWWHDTKSSTGSQQLLITSCSIWNSMNWYW